MLQVYLMSYEHLLHVRIPAELHNGLCRLRSERHINVSSWLRATIKNALAREGVLPNSTPSQIGSRAALLGWQPHRLEDGSWGSIYHGDSSSLPPELVGELIIVTDSNGDSFSTTITAVLERSSNQVVVTDSGRGH